MVKTYSRINWENYPSENTALDAENLNAMDSAVDIIDDRVISLDSGKLNITDASSLVKSIAFEKTTGTFTITFYNGSTATIDTDIEKVAVNFDYDSTTQKLIITLDDGTKKEIDLSALITQYEFTNTSTIGFTVATDGKVSANVLDNSITEAKIESKYLTNVKNYASAASTSASNASTSETNASTFASNASASATNASASESNALSYKNAAATSATNAKTSETNAKTSETNAKTSETNAKTSETNASTYAGNALSYRNAASTSASGASTSATNASNSATTAANKSLIAEGWAVGQQNGTDVGSSSPYYHNNAKYYSDKAGSTSLASLSDVGISSPSNGQYFTYDSSTSKWKNSSLDLSNYVQKNSDVSFGAVSATSVSASSGMTVPSVTGTLSAGSTSITISDSRITTSSIIDVYYYVVSGTATTPVCYNTITVSAGSVTMTFDALTSDLQIKIVILG